MKIQTCLRLDEIFNELNATPVENQKEFIESAFVIYPLFRPILKEAYSFFDWGDFPIETMEKFVATWDESYHWSLAPNVGLSRIALDLIEKVFKNENMTVENRSKRIESFLKNMCREESRAFFAVMTKNIAGVYPNISTEIVLEFFPELTVKI